MTSVPQFTMPEQRTLRRLRNALVLLGAVGLFFGFHNPLRQLRSPDLPLIILHSLRSQNLKIFNNLRSWNPFNILYRIYRQIRQIPKYRPKKLGVAITVIYKQPPHFIITSSPFTSLGKFQSCLRIRHILQINCHPTLQIPFFAVKKGSFGVHS
jgi:hypothetical protein